MGEQGGIETNEISPSNPEVAAPLKPFLIEFFHGKYDKGMYPGKTVREVIDWYNSPDYRLDLMLKTTLDKNPGRFSDQDIARGRSILRMFKDEGYDLSLYLETRQVVHPRHSKMIRRNKWVEGILSGKIQRVKDLDFPWFSNDKKELQQKTTQLIAAERERAAMVVGNVKTALAKDQAAPPLADKRTILIQTHREDKLIAPLESLDSAMSKTADKVAIQISYSDKKNEVLFADSKRLEIEDRDGTIPQESLRQYLQGQQEVIFVMSGGNLRGCMGSTFSSLLASCEAAGVRDVDFHFPLDTIYDSLAYNNPQQMLRFMPNVLKRYDNLNFRAFQNGVMTDAKEGKSERRFRLYFWDTTQMMTQQCQMQ